jgi:hypothetical protein
LEIKLTSGGMKWCRGAVWAGLNELTGFLSRNTGSPVEKRLIRSLFIERLQMSIDTGYIAGLISHLKTAVCFILWNFICQRFGTRCMFHLHRRVGMKMEQSVPKRRHINFRRRGITQKKAYNIV